MLKRMKKKGSASAATAPAAGGESKTSAGASGKPSVLILGGVGFIGRTLVKKLVDEQLCSRIRVCDKLIPIIAYCSEEHTQALAATDKGVEFMQCDLAQDSHIERAFDTTNGAFDIVVNLAAETRFGLDEALHIGRLIREFAHVVQKRLGPTSTFLEDFCSPRGKALLPVFAC